MNRWKNYLNRWTPGKGRKEGKKGLTQPSLSLEPPEIAGRVEEPSTFRNSFSLDSSIGHSSYNVIEEILTQKIIDSSSIDEFDRLIISTEEQTVSSSFPLNIQGISLASGIQVERRDSTSVTTSELLDYLPMTPIQVTVDRPFNLIPPPSSDPIQTPMAIPPPSSKPRLATDGYIPLDTCSSGKRIASFKLEQEERFNHLNKGPRVNSFHPEYVEAHPILPTKDIYFLESVPPIPSHNNIFHERLPGPPLPTKLNGTAPLTGRGRMYNSHSIAYSSQSPSPWSSGMTNLDMRELRNIQHTSLHYFPDRCHKNKSYLEPTSFGDYVECDTNNNEDFINHHAENSEVRDTRPDERGYYNDAVSSLHRRKRYQGNVSPCGLDRDSKELLRRPVPPPRLTSTHFHSYANEPRSNSFKRSPLEKAHTCLESYNSLRQKIEPDEIEIDIRELHPFPRRAQKISMSKKHRAACGDDTDSLDESSGYSNEDGGSTSEFMPSDESFNLRFAPKAKSVSRSIGKPRPDVEIKYLQLNLQQTPEDICETSSINRAEPEHVSNYREIDWLKTKALMETMHARTRIKGNSGPIIST